VCYKFQVNLRSIVLAICVAVSAMATPDVVSVTTSTGKVVTGKLASVSETEIVIHSDFGISRLPLSKLSPSSRQQLEGKRLDPEIEALKVEIARLKSENEDLKGRMASDMSALRKQVSDLQQEVQKSRTSNVSSTWPSSGVTAVPVRQGTKPEPSLSELSYPTQSNYTTRSNYTETGYVSPSQKVAPAKPFTAENGSYYGQANSYGVPKTTHVNGYFRKDGTYVRGHYRSR
jgi:hypothetical protein